MKLPKLGKIDLRKFPADSLNGETWGCTFFDLLRQTIHPSIYKETRKPLFYLKKKPNFIVMLGVMLNSI